MLDESYIQIAIELAKKGKGKVSPKPLVGALLVKNDKIISAAYRSSPEEESTEIIALNGAKENPEGAVLYTNLEPCCFSENEKNFTDILIGSKLKKIIIGSTNPHPEYGGSTIKKLRKAGVEIKTGVYEKECSELNKFYFKHVTQTFPYVTMVMASTLDGKIADKDGNSKWITSVESRSFVHELRTEYDAVLVGYNTVEMDNPHLTVRLVEGRNPKRIILDKELKLGARDNLVKRNYDKNLVVLTSKKNKTKKKKIEKLTEAGVEIIYVNEEKSGRLDLSHALKKIGERNVTSLLVEGGRRIFTGFLNNKLEDELIVFLGPKLLGNGIQLSDGMQIKNLRKAMKFGIKDFDKIGEDVCLKLVRR